MEMKNGDTHCELTIQHLEFGTIIGGSRISPNSILKACECARGVADQMYRDIVQPGEYFSDVRFLKWQQVEILPEFYRRKPIPSQPSSYLNIINRKMRLYHYLLPIGNSSHMLEDVMVDFETDTPLFVASVLGVHIDPETRRPLSFPRSIKDHFAVERCDKRIRVERKIEHRCLKKFDFVPLGGRFHVWECIISVRQIDRNHHLNQAAYLDICYDCLGDAFNNCAFGKTSALLDYDIRRMSILYLHEVLLGDEIVTVVWEDGSNPFIYKFHIKKGSVITCQAEIELFETKFTLKANL